MKKMAYVLLISLLCLIVVGGYGIYQTRNKDNKSNKKQTNNNQTNKNDNQTNDIEPIVSVKTDETLNIQTTVAVEDSLPEKSQRIDDMLQKELDSGRYTFKEPMVVLDPFQNSPLTAIALFTTNKKYGVRVTVKGDAPVDDVVGELDPNTSHRVPIIGLYPGRENTVLIELLDDTGNVVDENTIMLETDALPDNMKDIVETVSVTQKSAYNLIQVSGQKTPHPFAFDSTGTIRWYLTMKTDGYGMFPLTNNRFMLFADGILIQTIAKPHTAEMYEMDHLGRIHQVYYVEKGVHHDVAEKTPGGNLLVLSNSNEGHLEDMVQEIDRETGEIVKTLVLSEIFGETYVDMLDWAHLNTVSYEAASDSLILSPRNIHSGIKVNWSTNELVWILSDPRFWEGTPFENKVLQGEGDIIWHYQPHSIYEVAEDLDNDPNTIHIMMYDNHWHKTRKVDYFDNLEDSYVSIYTINEDTMTVTQPHVYAGVKSKITSNYTLDYDEKRVFSMGGYLDPVIDGMNGMIYEYDYDTEEVLNQYALKYTFYRGYELIVDYNGLATPMDIGENYMKGVLQAPKLLDNMLEVPSNRIEEGVTFKLIKNVLYMRSADHDVSQVEFIGADNTYLLDLTHNGEGESKYKKLVYSIPIPLSVLDADTYQIIVNYEGTRSNTGETITIE